MKIPHSDSSSITTVSKIVIYFQQQNAQSLLQNSALSKHLLSNLAFQIFCNVDWTIYTYHIYVYLYTINVLVINIQHFIETFHKQK